MDNYPTAAPIQTSLIPVETGPGCTAWRATERDAPGLFALISNEHALPIQLTLETDGLTIAIFDEGVEETLGSIEIDGRAGLNRWYLKNVGYEPDKEPDGPRPILELIDLVAAHLLLRYFEQGRNEDKPVTATTPHPTIFDALHAVAHAQGGRISLTDHRGRQFLKDFFVDNAPAVRRYGVWGYSASGASQLVVWKGRGRGLNGNRVRSGWGNPKNAQVLADQLNEAAAAWRRQYGPVPKPKAKAKKHHK